jgi:hypothetical protein
MVVPTFERHGQRDDTVFATLAIPLEALWAMDMENPICVLMNNDKKNVLVLLNDWIRRRLQPVE